jgi:hypothetical protein
MVKRAPGPQSVTAYDPVQSVRGRVRKLSAKTAEWNEAQGRTKIAKRTEPKKEGGGAPAIPAPALAVAPLPPIPVVEEVKPKSGTMMRLGGFEGWAAGLQASKQGKGGKERAGEDKGGPPGGKGPAGKFGNDVRPTWTKAEDDFILNAAFNEIGDAYVCAT